MCSQSSTIREYSDVLCHWIGLLHDNQSAYYVNSDCTLLQLGLMQSPLTTKATRKEGNKKLSSCCDSRSYCMHQYEWRFGRSRSSKVTDFGTNRVCDFLLVRHSNIGPILHRFRDIVGYFVLMTQSIFTLFLGYSRCTRSPMFGSIWAGTLSYSAVKLFSKYSNLCDHITGNWTPQTDGQVD